jgi:hypothetical protein
MLASDMRKRYEHILSVHTQSHEHMKRDSYIYIDALLTGGMVCSLKRETRSQ